MSEATKLLLVDARGLLWRAFDSQKMLSAVVDGEEMATGGIYGFLNTLVRIHPRYGSPRMIVCWEGTKNFRFRLYPQYKDKAEPPTPERAELNEELWEQERHLIALLAAIGVEQFRCPAGEADDVMARLAKETPGRVIIYSGDSDMRQLVDERVLVAAAGKKHDVIYTPKKVFEKHGVWPRHIAALKALAGDGSDNIPGIRDVGPKTAAKLLNHYGSLKKTLRAAVENDPGWPMTQRIRDLVAMGEADARRFFQLTNVRTDLPMERVGNLSAYPSREGIMDQLRKYSFRSLAMALEMKALWAMSAHARKEP
jgi:DNA polymerase-1